MNTRIFHKLLQPLSRRVSMLVSRAVLRAISETHGRQHVKVVLHKGETLEGVEVFQHYGLATRALPGAEAVSASIGGVRGHSIIIAVEDSRYRPELEPGEAALHDDQDQTVHIYRDRIEVRSDKKVVVKCDDVHLGSEGGPQVARIGDHVLVANGSSAGLWPIVEGSSKVRAS